MNISNHFTKQAAATTVLGPAIADPLHAWGRMYNALCCLHLWLLGVVRQDPGVNPYTIMLRLAAQCNVIAAHFGLSSAEFDTAVAAELADARLLHPTPARDVWHGYAILAKEIHEFRQLAMGEERPPAQFQNGARVMWTRDRCREELIQIAAMAQRVAEDLFGDWA